MQDVVVVGDGPGGLSAALFLAKGGRRVTVFGQDKTAMHWALLRNYLGVDEEPGGDFQARARKQVMDMGAQVDGRRVEKVAQVEGGFTVSLDDGETVRSRFLILSEGKSPRLAQQLGLEVDERRGVVTDRNGKTTLDGVYAVGRLARPGRSQAIISAGDGAASAIDILSTLKGEDVTDWDSIDG